MVNNAVTTSAVNLTVGGTITTDASGLNGVAGPIALVASGAISVTGNISARANNNGSSTTALGGGVFISSGGTGANAIAVQSINTSATNNGAGDKAGNIILLSSQPTTSTTNPSNITLGTLTQTGGTAGTAFVYGLNGASTTVPTSLNVTPTASINIQPGGYQSVTGTIALTINTNGDTQMVTPINIGAGSGGTSITLSSLTQANGTDNINFVTAGSFATSAALTVNSLSTGSNGITILTNNNIATGGALTLTSSSGINLAALGIGISGSTFAVNLTATQNISLLGGINTSTASSVPAGAVSLVAGSSIITTGTINSSSSTGYSAGTV